MPGHAIRAVVFDLDGTLIDSEPNYREADARFLVEHGILISDEEWSDIVGMGGPAFIELLRARGLTGSTDALIAEKDERYLAHAAGRTRAFPRVLELVRYLGVHGIPLAVATSSRRVVADAMLAEVGLVGSFHAVVASDEVPHPKPAPDLYLEAARRLGVEPSECLAIEDSQYGVEAACDAGMRVVAMPAPGTEGKPGFARADLLVVGGAERLELADVVRRFKLARESDTGTVVRFQAVVREFFEGAARPMPWRETNDPYRILVSEFMLQQTQVARVLPKYEAFLERFPTIETLAEANLSDVLALWQGLGYNRRGKNLRDAARFVCDHFGGVVPSEPEQLERLPGVGGYTASAVAAFAFARPVVVLETNIRRLFIHYFLQLEENVHDRQIEPLIRETLPSRGVREWYYALMDYGSYLGRTFANPNRRSRHYTRQSAFAGSVREVRGRIVRVLTARGTLTMMELERAVGPTDERFVPALDALERDGIVRRERDRVSLQ